jgi:hypothetical protein
MQHSGIPPQPRGIDDYLLVLNETLRGELGLQLVVEKDGVDVLVVDTVHKASENESTFRPLRSIPQVEHYKGLVNLPCDTPKLSPFLSIFYL